MMLERVLTVVFTAAAVGCGATAVALGYTPAGVVFVQAAGLSAILAGQAAYAWRREHRAAEAFRAAQRSRVASRARRARELARIS
ncbi:hypothetical protein AB0F93_00280 [Micromonospora tulbaghiae]|uniref:hypothetical protein n=1 Tax=Micromonospora tulbaghiae TaxID=479978 RepID=UPI00332F8299